MEAIVDNASDGMRLDVFLSSASGLTRSHVEKLIHDGHALIDGKQEHKAGCKLRSGNEIRLNIPDMKAVETVAQDIPLKIVYEDEHLAVVSKPRGMVVHPANGNDDGTMVNALLYHLSGLSGIGGELRPGIVHRIDKDTTGLLLVAKNDAAHLSLSEQIKEHSVKRAYKAILQGSLKVDSGIVDAPIGRHPKDRKKMAVVQDGRNATTNYVVLEYLRGATLIEARLTTGRTHQIRVHMASIGYPVLGDPLYGPKKPVYPNLNFQLLHAYMLGFEHPATHEQMLFEEPLPDDFLFWLNKLKM